MKNISAWAVKAGSFKRFYATQHHAEQMARALRFNGMRVAVYAVRLPNDPLTRLTLSI